MTDKQLKQLLTPVAKSDEEFVNRVMRQLPKSDLSWRPVWTIRIIALVIGVVVLVFSHELMPIINDILTLGHASWTLIVLIGVMVALGTLWVCRENEII